MPQDGIVAGERATVVEQAVARADSPQRRRAHFVGTSLSAILDDAVSGAHIVQQEVTVRMDDLISQCRGYGERSAIDDRAGRSGHDPRDVADVAADLAEELLTGLRSRRGRQSSVARRRFASTHEASKRVDVVVRVFRISNGIERSHGISHGSTFLREQAVGDALFVQVGVGSERQQAGVLVLPAEASATVAPWRLQHGNLNEGSRNPAAALPWLTVGDCSERVAVDGFDVTITQSI